MIFVTIGTQEPFDRLIQAIDEIAPLLGGEEIIVQAPLKSYVLKNLKAQVFMDPVDFGRYFKSADLIISHAGMGTIISALEIDKPIIVMPRLVKYGEHRNEHQLATARKLKSLNYIHVADDEEALKRILLEKSQGAFKSLHQLGRFASDSLLSSIQRYIKQE